MNEIIYGNTYMCLALGMDSTNINSLLLMKNAMGLWRRDRHESKAGCTFEL